MTALPTLLTGVVPPVCTPLTPDNEVDVASLERLVDHLVGAGVDALFVLGSSSEAAYLPDGHRRTVVSTVVRHAGGQLPVLAGAIDMTTLRVLDHVRDAADAGADGVVVTAPFYTRTHPAEIARHYRLVAERGGLPVFAYDLPVSVHTKLDADLVLDLAADGTLAGLKDSSGDDGGLRRVILGAPPAFSVLTGSELTVDSALAMGAHGVVPGLGNVDPDGYVRLYRAARAGDRDGARAEQERLCALFGMTETGSPARMGRSSSSLGAFKAALHLRGVIAHPTTAVPQIPLSPEDVERVGKHLATAGLL
ncbi:dihydrodipicolinate synthase family protein [Streptomyces spectabilis]|uniref:4-hydroxy-tetrahydrodipicolinate synthase n=1 Tax=Streptomyces spectabilis TaxID=68270 RepID=A0A5P2X4I9_STRST|nr:dihydrodipicolinate synthase family protein [Streptomyces spectabilis]MBB5103420.1 4-hydroxy-tetrahydrodipicolinate synthase [Streptomyces spectabilis]MCI3902610.1 dihydrodipicolinate synthase family protein [Streptomyces spectabilis]QEV59933.1 dihydrodipicolinate synthase family protein [Streptomyces spectabilis]GGV49046.1 dihydrodipicolinate synthase family protein [Streptomyces spectabilis]